jgi:hypothetical protein
MLTDEPFHRLLRRLDRADHGNTHFFEFNLEIDRVTFGEDHTNWRSVSSNLTEPRPRATRSQSVFYHTHCRATSQSCDATDAIHNKPGRTSR